MRRLIVGLLALIVAGTPASSASGAKRHSHHRRHHHHRHARRSHTGIPVPGAPRRSGIDEGEYYLRATHPTLAAGAVELDPVNLGMDEHNMTIRDSRGSVLGQITAQPGQTVTLRLNLAAGEYTLYCSLQNHERLGMRSSLSVR